jgi:hypothetical protein
MLAPMRWFAFIISFVASGFANAQTSSNFSTQDVLTGYADGYKGDLFYVGFVSGVVSGIFYYNAAAQRTHGNPLICLDEDVKLNGNDVISMIKGDLAKMDVTSRKLLLKIPFRAYALTTIAKTFPCK